MGRDSGSRGNHFPVAGMTYSGGEDEFDGSYLAQIQQILFCCPNFSMSQKRELPGANLRRAPMPQSPFFSFPRHASFFSLPPSRPKRQEPRRRRARTRSWPEPCLLRPRRPPRTPAGTLAQALSFIPARSGGGEPARERVRTRGVPRSAALVRYSSTLASAAPEGYAAIDGQ